MNVRTRESKALCEGCAKVVSKEYSDTKSFCGGIVREPNPQQDVIRYCFKDGEEILECDDLHVVEALDLSSLLTMVVAHYFDHIDLPHLSKWMDEKKIHEFGAHKLEKIAD